jgi:Fe-Mn family superoxide dismutase
MDNIKKRIQVLEDRLKRNEILKEESLHEAKKIRAEKLPYGYSALRQFIDPETMNIHYNKHYKGYISKLNDALEGKNYGDLSLEEIIRTIERFSKVVRDNAGGAFNHAIFWKMLSPTEMEPKGEILKKINSNFGSLSNFKKKFEDYAKKRFGSGWVWLVLTKRGTLKIMTTPNQDNPLMDIVKQGGYPLLGLDLWEHAYYLKYRNKRDEYIKNFWKVVNWEFVDKEYNRLTNKNIQESRVVKKYLTEQRTSSPCNDQERLKIRQLFNNNPNVLNLYKETIMSILKDVYPTKYYERGEYKRGEAAGVYDLEKPGRSIINYLNTNYSAFCPLVKDLNRVLSAANREEINFDGKTPEEQVQEMNRMLYYIDQLKNRIFSPNSKTLQTIFQILNTTSGRGTKTEDIAEKKFKEKFGVENVKRIGELGSKEDMMGIDIKVTVDGKEYTGQVKPFDSITEIDGMYRVKGTANVKKYKTDWMIFIRRGNEVVVFDNNKSQIKDGTYNYPLDSMLYQF